ncbi:hypothetical protein HBN50_03460 [Halobacteriovorax sp. GB3]|uniref:hypothetical protein n=1 Tax=Halobacteriovorax sp. GB3 TaxID=2719615 RepID=UPI00235F98F4|nr:hypothetical protein [Halobacteriovorax sp. GB3]MDD0852135.1 hypothetical protein [Halobacteriovorax sp. GB3]
MKYFFIGLAFIVPFVTTASEFENNQINLRCASVEKRSIREKEYLQKELEECLAINNNQISMCRYQVIDLENYNKSYQHLLPIFLLDENEVTVALNIDCKEKTLVTSIYDFISPLILKRNSKVNFKVEEKRIEFNLDGRDVVIDLNVQDLEFEEDTREYNTYGEVIDGELKTFEYEDKVVFFRDNFNGVLSIHIDGKSIREDNYRLTLSDLLYEQEDYLTNMNVLNHRITYKEQLSYRSLLSEISKMQ